MHFVTIHHSLPIAHLLTALFTFHEHLKAAHFIFESAGGAHVSRLKAQVGQAMKKSCIFS